jgi:hypothetical protein
MFAPSFTPKTSAQMPTAIPLASAAVINQNVTINDGLNHASIGSVTIAAGVVTVTNGTWKIL